MKENKQQSTPLSEDDILMLIGRMYECCDIQLAIESGQISSLDEVLEGCRLRAQAINAQLLANGVRLAGSTGQ